MSADEYAISLAQKYRLAISMAVLKTKPENLTINEYIEEIRDAINSGNNDTSQQDLNMTACSEDFSIDDDDDEITEIESTHDFNCDQIDRSIVINEPQFDRNKSNNGNMIQEYHKTTDNHPNDSNAIRSSEKYHQIDSRTKVNSKGIEVKGDKTQAIDMTTIQPKLQENAQRILENENNIQITDTDIGETGKSDPNKERREKFRELIRILKDDVPTEKVIEVKPTTISEITKSFDPTDLDLTQCYVDTNYTFLHMDRLTDVHCEIINAQNPNIKPSTCYDSMNVCNSVTTSNLPSEINTLAYNKDRQEVRKRKTDFDAQENTNTDNKLLKITKNYEINPLNSVENNTLCYTMENSHKEANNKPQNEIHFAPKTNILDHRRISHTEVTNNTIQNENIDSCGVINRHDTQFNSHYSESQMFDIVIDKNLIHGNKNQNVELNAKNDKEKYENSNTNKENAEDIAISIFTHKTKDLPKSQNFTNTQNEFIFTVDQSQDHFASQRFEVEIDDCTENGETLLLDKNGKVNDNNTEFTMEFLQHDGKAVNNCYKDDITNKQIYQIHTEKENIENNTAFSQTENACQIQNSLISNLVNEDNNKVLNKNKELDTIDTENEKDYTDFDKSKEIDEVEVTEKVPFKILEEMNQIKSYLSRNREFKDSGYKSSQSQRSGIGTQPSSLRVGESANSVFIYLTSCPLDIATQELTEQISKVLGQIIDRLHEEEIYPMFLEELLNTVEKLLHLVYEGESTDFDVLQTKDEQIQRIILLNKSSHIKKFTIEKIINILQKLIDEISDTKYEIQEINKLENLCYIFHILQILLPKYKQGNIYNSQASQPSQEVKVLKKQDISDIWRRKWFSNSKEPEIESSLENKCVLKECSTILNKIIVNFIDGYSLIAYSALQCFNLIQ